MSIIIPVLNEIDFLPCLLETLKPTLDPHTELIIVDGGSRDGSREYAQRNGVRVLMTSPGRAQQMNAGAAAANGDILLFLHADTYLPVNALSEVRSALGSGCNAWGRFDVRIDGRARTLHLVGWLMNQRSRWSGIATGDQAIFVDRQTFFNVGGFPEQPLMEDIELSRRLLKRSAPACLRVKAVTSGRRWESRGVWRTILLMWRLRWAYWRGVSAERLAAMYQ